MTSKDQRNIVYKSLGTILFCKGVWLNIKFKNEKDFFFINLWYKTDHKYSFCLILLINYSKGNYFCMFTLMNTYFHIIFQD